MYRCSRCQKNFKRLPRKIYPFGGNKVLLACRKCQNSKDFINLSSLEMDKIARVFEQVPTIEVLDSHYLGGPGRREIPYSFISNIDCVRRT